LREKLGSFLKKIKHSVCAVLYPKKWHIRSGSKQYGPCTWKELRKAVRDEKVGPDDLVKADRMKDWAKARHVNGLFSKQNFATFMVENYRLLAPVVVVAVVLFVGGHFVFTGVLAQDTPEEAQEEINLDDEQVDVLPVEERLVGETDPGFLEDPFEAPLVLVGVLQSGEGRNIATVRSGNIIFYVQEGDLIAGTWRIEEIHLDRVFLSSEEREIMLKMD